MRVRQEGEIFEEGFNEGVEEAQGAECRPFFLFYSLRMMTGWEAGMDNSARETFVNIFVSQRPRLMMRMMRSAWAMTRVMSIGDSILH